MNCEQEVAQLKEDVAELKETVAGLVYDLADMHQKYDGLMDVFDNRKVPVC